MLTPKVKELDHDNNFCLRKCAQTGSSTSVDVGKEEKYLLNLSENKNLLIIQIVKYKNSTVSFESIKIDNLNLENKTLNVSSNNDSRILWNGPNCWLLGQPDERAFKRNNRKI